MSKGRGEALKKLEALERSVNARLKLLDRLKENDIHKCAWKGMTELVEGHIELASATAAAPARKEVRLARKRLEGLESESLVMGEHCPEDEAAADGYEITVAYEEKLDEARDVLASAEKKCRGIEIAAAKETANLIDETEFGEGYRPLHYAAYAGHLDTVRLLLDHGASIDTKNHAGCDPMFLAAQQGRQDIVRELLDRGNAMPENNENFWCGTTVPTGDGRRLCALDLFRPSDRAPRRHRTRAILLEDLGAPSTTAESDPLNDHENNYDIHQTTSSAKRSCSRKPPNFQKKKPPQPPPPELTPTKSGGLHILWTPNHYQATASYRPPVNHLKIKVSTTADNTVVLMLVVNATTHRVRIASSRLSPQQSYIAQIAAVNVLGASEYSDPSPAATVQTQDHQNYLPPTEDTHTQRQWPEAPKQRYNLDPKIARARNAVRAGREKRQRISELLKTEDAKPSPEVNLDDDDDVHDDNNLQCDQGYDHLLTQETPHTADESYQQAAFTSTMPAPASIRSKIASSPLAATTIS